MRCSKAICSSSPALLIVHLCRQSLFTSTHLLLRNIDTHDINKSPRHHAFLDHSSAPHGNPVYHPGEATPVKLQRHRTKVVRRTVRGMFAQHPVGLLLLAWVQAMTRRVCRPAHCLYLSAPSQRQPRCHATLTSLPHVGSNPLRTFSQRSHRTGMARRKRH